LREETMSDEENEYENGDFWENRYGRFKTAFQY